MLMLEDEVGDPLSIVPVTVLASPPTCTAWSCRGHESQREAREVHEALDVEARQPS